MTGQPILPRATDLAGLQIVPLKDVVLTQGVARALDFTLSDMYDKIVPQESIYIDNPHDAIVTVLAPRSGQIIKAPPRSIGWYPLILPAPVQFAISYTPARSTQTMRVSYSPRARRRSPRPFHQRSPEFTSQNMPQDKKAAHTICAQPPPLLMRHIS